MEIRRATPADRDALADVWLRSVRATHLFLTEADIDSLLPHVREYQSSKAELWIAVAAGGAVAGFMGLAGNRMESLFLAPEFHRRCLGRRLVQHARALRSTLTVDVNEQNPGACRFYEACGFVVTGRSEVDDAGRPFPLLRMRMAK